MPEMGPVRNGGLAQRTPIDSVGRRRRASMAGSCSCRTGLHAFHGNNPGAAPETGVYHRHRDLPGLRWGRADRRSYASCARGISASLHVIACIEDPVVIEKIVTHLDEKGGAVEPTRRPPCRASPPTGLFD